MSSSREKRLARQRTRQRQLAAARRETEANPEPPATQQSCPRCGTAIAPSPSGRGRPRTWCSQVCRRAAYEERRAAANGVIAKEIVVRQVEPPWDETIERVLASPKACQRVLRTLSDRLAAGELSYSPWDSIASDLWHLNSAWKTRGQ